MGKFKLLKLLASAMAVLLMLSFASCHNDNGEGEMTDQSSVSKSGMDNTVEKKEDYLFTRDYYNWLYADAFKDLAQAVKVTKLPAELETALSSLSDEKKASTMREIFCSKELVSAVQTVSEYESENNKYTHDVVSVKRNQKGIYVIKMKFASGGVETEKNYELMLSETTKAISLINYNDDGEVLDFHQLVVTNDGYVAVTRANSSADGWTSMQLLFKGGDKPEGYCTIESKLKDEPAQIYPNSVYAGFAGKK